MTHLENPMFIEQKYYMFLGAAAVLIPYGCLTWCPIQTWSAKFIQIRSVCARRVWTHFKCLTLCYLWSLGEKEKGAMVEMMLRVSVSLKSHWRWMATMLVCSVKYFKACTSQVPLVMPKSFRLVFSIDCFSISKPYLNLLNSYFEGTLLNKLCEQSRT